MKLLAEELGPADAINNGTHVIKRQLPYYGSDYVLIIACIFADGERLEHVELPRYGEMFPYSQIVKSISDPTTVGDFCWRLKPFQIHALMDATNEAQLGVWARHPTSFFGDEILSVIGAIASALVECKQGTDFAYNGIFDCHAGLVSLAHTNELLFVCNRNGNRLSREGMVVYLNQAIELCQRAMFRKIALRGDTDFTQTTELDRWGEEDSGFLFGADKTVNRRLGFAPQWMTNCRANW